MAKRPATARAKRAPRSLAAYHRKRDLTQSGEPAGDRRARRSPAPRYVIQKHDATRLHYDFRLEAAGVLKSWAVPKGLPTRAGERALAIEVEDHPLDYGGFEGTIPRGNYGAGTVMLWDRGHYALEGDDFATAYRAGKIHVALAGEKLRGEWTLVRMRPRPGEAKTAWLVIRNRVIARPPAKPRGAAVRRDRSVLTGRTMDEIAGGSGKATRRARGARRAARKPSPDDADDTSAPRKKSPLGFVPPMKALGVTAVPEGSWHCEIKFDGYRALAGVAAGQAPRLWSRNGNLLSADYPEIVEALARLKCRDALLDGEIVALDGEGRSRFQLLQQRGTARERPPIQYYIFDLLRLDGVSLVDEPFERRRAMLAQWLREPASPLRLSTVFEVGPETLLAEAGRMGLEGIVAKAAGSLYEPGRRSGAWLKCRIASEQELVIGGFTPPEGGRRHLGALLVGYYRDDALLYAGKVGTGFDERTLADLAGRLAPLRATECPFANLPTEGRTRAGQTMNSTAMRAVRWVRPKLVCQVRFAEWTDEGRLRHPVYLGLRHDKPAREVVREAPGIKASASVRAPARKGRRVSPRARGPARD